MTKSTIVIDHKKKSKGLFLSLRIKLYKESKKLKELDRIRKFW